MNKFDCKYDPVVDLEVRITGFANHPFCQMVTIRIMRRSISKLFPRHNVRAKGRGGRVATMRYTGNNNSESVDQVFWNMFRDGVDISLMGCVLAMKKCTI